MILLYNFLLILTSFFWLPRMIFRARRRKEMPDWSQRAGDVRMPAAGTNPKRIWLHAVSVGEVMASLPVLADLKKRLPGWEFVLSVTTSSGHETAKTKAAGLYDHLIYAPIDLLRFTVRAMVRIKPAALVIMETELWYSLLWSAKEMGAAAILANGRISDRSLRRSKPFAFFYREVFGCFARLLMQTEQDKERAVALGAKNVEVFGNTKYQEALDALGADPAHWRKELGITESDFVLFMGSTRGEDDETPVLEGIAKAFPRLEGIKVIWAPRHLERTADLAKRIEPIFGSPALRSKGEKGQVILLDTYGELSQAYCIADLVIIGGGFANLGGQNLIQPLAHGKPVLHGPHMQNFRHASEQAKEAGASLMVQGSEELASALKSLKSDPQKRQQMGRAGAAFVKSHAGATERIAAAIAEEAQKVWDERERDRIDKEKRRKLREAQQKQKGK
jgi:3-deoxy-D-manno-octulosonic-acid transferase